MKHSSKIMQSAIELFEQTAATASSSSQVDEFLALMPGTPRHTAIGVYLLFCAADPISFLARTAPRLHGLTLLNLEAGAFELQRTYGRKQARTVRGVFTILPSCVDNIYRLVSISDSAFWNVAVKRFIRDIYPRIVPIFFRQAELREALENFERKLGGQYRLMVGEISMKERRADVGIHRVSARHDTDRKWTERTAAGVFDDALERRQWFTKIAFRVLYRKAEHHRFVPIASCRLYKYGHVHFNRLYREFTDSLLPVLERSVHERIVLFSNRGIRERDYQPGKPLEIVYGANVFDEKEDLQRFTKMLMGYPHASKALFDSNPYLHASVADFKDGSSFEIWILSPRRILIVPQAKASIPALGRLTSYIFSEFQEGKIGEYSG